MLTHPMAQHIELWPIERLREYPRNPRKNDRLEKVFASRPHERGYVGQQGRSPR